MTKVILASLTIPIAHLEVITDVDASNTNTTKCDTNTTKEKGTRMLLFALIKLLLSWNTYLHSGIFAVGLTR